MRIVRHSMIDSYFKSLRERRKNVDLKQRVKDILDDVYNHGDEALFNYTEKFDGVRLDDLEVTKEEIKKALERIDKKLYKSLVRARDNIERYHKMQLRATQYLEVEGGRLGELIRPLKKVGIYVPGGKASYPSTVLMNGVPAKLAGVKEVIMVTPPCKDGSIKDSVLVAAYLAGVDRIFKIGGAQAIGALAYGTDAVSKVNKIVGPGNAYVATAKSLVSDIVGIDMIAGPSEIMILADESANPAFVAADMISQAEHDEKAASIAVLKESLVSDVIDSLNEQLSRSPRSEIINASLDNESAIIIVETEEEMIDVANRFAPEHLEIMTENSDILVDRIENAGAIFVGAYSPEPLGDYLAGPNHTLPTSGTAAFSSPLGIDDFIKKTSYISYTREGLEKVKKDIVNIATDEGLYGHAEAIKIRFGEDNEN